MGGTEHHGHLPDGVVRDPARLAAVRSTDLVDHERLAELDRLTAVARAMLGAAATFLSIVEERRDFYLSESGFGEPLHSERSLTGTTFCHLAIRSSEPLVINDTSSNPEHLAIPTVESLGVATYVGIPVHAPDAQILGSFCAIDQRPREWSSAEVDLMVELAASAERWIALRELGRHVAESSGGERAGHDDHWHVEKTERPLSYCMRCHRVSSDDQHWERLVDVLARSGMLVSHRYCPICAPHVTDTFAP